MSSIFLLLLGAYIIGSVSGSFILGKVIKGIDIRNHGSGNAGTTNAMRIMGKKLGIGTLIIDCLKGMLAMFILTPFISKEYYYLIALFAVLGHDYPFYMKFKGGKGIATTCGSLAWLNLPFTFFSVACGISVALISKYVSLGSMTFLIVSSFVFSVFLPLSLINRIALIFMCVLGVYRHKSNIHRLRVGKENKLGG